MNFREATQAVKIGKKVSRPEWNGKCLCLMPDADTDYPPGTVHACPPTRFVGGTLDVESYWFASQADMLAEDWEIQ
jgi:hypothetical protein